jgi:hypothetical protein
MSGASNVLYYLECRGLPTTPEVVQAVLAEAKKSERLLAEETILEIVQSVRGSSGTTGPAGRP